MLVHGYVCNRGFWAPWMIQLRRQGVPVVAITLEPVVGSIDDYAGAIEAAVRQLEAATGQPPLLVGHSMGGLAIRAWRRAFGVPAARVRGVITLGTPHQGTWLAHFAPTRNGQQMVPGSHWLRDLAASEPADWCARLTCWYSHCDCIVFPAHLACLPGAVAQHHPGVAHVALAFEPAVFQAVCRRLG